MQDSETQKRNQELFLQHEDYINKILAIRSPQKPSPRWWERLLNSPGGVALITVVIGGLIGGAISQMYQRAAKDRELAMLAYKDFVEKRSNLETELYGKIGSAVSASEDLISLSKRDLTIRPELDAETKTALKTYQKSIVDKFDAAEADWRKDRDRLGLLMDYYHPEQPTLLATWTTVKNSVTSYVDCSKKWHREHPIDDNIDGACPGEKTNLTNALQTFSAEIRKNRTYLWKG